MAKETIWVEEEQADMAEGEKLTFSITFKGAVSVSSPSVVVYKNGLDVTSTVMPSGSNTVSANVVTMKPLIAIAGDGGQIYVVACSAIVDGNTEIRKVQINVHKVSATL